MTRIPTEHMSFGQPASVASTVLLIVGLLSGCTPDGPRLLSLDGDLSGQLEELRRSIGDRRVVLLGENGHGVGSLTTAKSALVEWLHRDLGFEVVAFESGYFECGRLNTWDDRVAEDALFDCLRYPFQHRELLPVFRLIEDAHTEGADLLLAGIDIQAQGFDSAPRPEFSRRALEAGDPRLAAEVARIDSLLYLVEDDGGLGDSIHAWAADHGDSAIATYRSAADLTTGWERGVFQLAEGWVERLRTRGQAEADPEARGIPPRYYELRDEWMARAVRLLADSVYPDRKVVVWLHNDHARYGRLQSPSGPIRSTGGYLREWMGDDVFSIGLFMGPGQVVDNGRRERDTGPFDEEGIESRMHLNDTLATLAILRDPAGRPAIRWATEPRPYMRMGLHPDTLVLSDEFDAVLYLPRAHPPDFGVRH